MTKTTRENPENPGNQPHPQDRAAREQELLVVRCQLGEPAAFDDLVARWHEQLWRYLCGMTADRRVAEDVLQDAWLRILRGIHRLRQPERLRAWLFSIVRRAFADRLRLRYAEKDIDSLDEPRAQAPADASLRQAVAAGDPAVEALAAEEIEYLRAALGDLSPPDREAMILFYLQEFTLREVADVQEVPVGTVKSRLHRGRRQLRVQLGAKGVAR